jgi:hypothetical protein
MVYPTLTDDVETRLHRFEIEHAVRACMNRYMVLCDDLNVKSPIDELAALFTEDAIWEGVGERYAHSFGRKQSRPVIREMFSKYAVEPSHFALNVHFLTSELISVDEAGVSGGWVMLQTSTFASGDSHLNAARLTVRFEEQDGKWRIAHFQTENLFSRPVTTWNDEAPLPVPAE